MTATTVDTPAPNGKPAYPAPPASPPTAVPPPAEIARDATWHGLTWEQYNRLCQALSLARVHRDPNGHSYVKAHEISRTLTGVFGFGGWSQDVTRLDCVYEKHREWPAPTDKDQHKLAFRSSVVYVATVRLTITCPDGTILGPYEDAASGDAQNQTSPGEAYDLAAKAAVSTALKRAARHLGDQFGLSLYVGHVGSSLTGSLVHPPAPAGVAVTDEGLPNVRPEVPAVEIDARVTKFLRKVYADDGGDDGPRVIASYEDLRGKLWAEAGKAEIIDLPALVTPDGQILTVRQVLMQEGLKLGAALKAARQRNPEVVVPADLDNPDDAGQGRLDCGCDAQETAAAGRHQPACAKQRR